MPGRLTDRCSAKPLPNPTPAQRDSSPDPDPDPASSSSRPRFLLARPAAVRAKAPRGSCCGCMVHVGAPRAREGALAGWWWWGEVGCMRPAIAGSISRMLS